MTDGAPPSFRRRAGERAAVALVRLDEPQLLAYYRLTGDEAASSDDEKENAPEEEALWLGAFVLQLAAAAGADPGHGDLVLLVDGRDGRDEDPVGLYVVDLGRPGRLHLARSADPVRDLTFPVPAAVTRGLEDPTGFYRPLGGPPHFLGQSLHLQLDERFAGALAAAAGRPLAAGEIARAYWGVPWDDPQGDAFWIRPAGEDHWRMGALAQLAPEPIGAKRAPR
jgi:hypothetical protein